MVGIKQRWDISGGMRMSDRTASHRIDLKKSRIMSKSSTLLKLKRAANRPTNKAKRARGLTNHLRKEGSVSRPSPRYEAIANLDLLEFIKYDSLDIQFVLEHKIINTNGFMSHFTDIAFPNTGITEKIQHLINNHEQRLTDTFYRYLESAGVVLDPIIPEMDIRYYEDTTTADIATSSDVPRDKKAKKKEIILHTLDSIMEEVQSMELTSENLELMSELMTMKEEADQPYVERDLVRVLYHLTEAYKPMDIVVFGPNQEVGHVVRVDSQDSILADPITGEMFGVANSDIKYVIGNLLKEHFAIYEGEELVETSLNDFQAQLGQQIVNGIYDGDIVDKQGLDTALATFYVNRKDAKEYVLRYLVAINAHETHVNKFLIMANKIDPEMFPIDADTFILDTIEATPDLKDDKSIVLWVAKTTLKNANKKPSIMSRLFSKKVLLTLVAAAFVFGKESGLLWKYTEKLLPRIKVPGTGAAPVFMNDFMYQAAKYSFKASGFDPRSYADRLTGMLGARGITYESLEQGLLDNKEALMSVFEICDYEQLLFEDNYSKFDAEINKQKERLVQRLNNRPSGSRKLSPSQMASREMDIEVIKRLEVQRDIAALTAKLNRAPKQAREEIASTIATLRAAEMNHNSEIEHLAKIRALDKPGPRQRHISREEVLTALGKTLGDVSLAAQDLGVSEPHLANLRKIYGIGLSRQGRKKSIEAIKRDASVLVQIDSSFDALHHFVKSFKLKKMAATATLISGLAAKGGIDRYLKKHSVQDLLISVFAAAILLISTQQVVEASPARFKRVVDQFKKTIRVVSADGKAGEVNKDLLKMMGVESAPPMDQQKILQMYNDMYAESLQLKAKVDKKAAQE